MKLSKKGQTLSALTSYAIAVVIFIIVLAISVTVMSNVQEIVGDQECASYGGIAASTTWNATGGNCCLTNGTCYGAGVGANLTVAGMEGMSLFSDFTSIIILVAVAAVVLGLIAVAFVAFR